MSSRKTAKVKAKHLGLAMYLDEWLDELRSNQENDPNSDYDNLISVNNLQGDQGLFNGKFNLMHIQLYKIVLLLCQNRIVVYADILFNLLVFRENE